MNTYVKNAAASISTRWFRYYEVLDNAHSSWEDDQVRARRTTSKRKKEPQHIISSFSYRRDRAKKRQIFLQSYKLSPKVTPAESTSKGIKKAFVKVKAVAVSVLAIVRIDALRTCGVSRIPTLSASSPIAVRTMPRAVPAY